MVYVPDATSSSDISVLANGQSEYPGSIGSENVEPPGPSSAGPTVNDVLDATGDIAEPPQILGTPLQEEDQIRFLDSLAAQATPSLEVDAENGQTTYMGKNASANLFRSIVTVDGQPMLPSNISLESAFCLTNRVPLHPFGSLWTTVGVTLFDILQTLSNPEECMM